MTSEKKFFAKIYSPPLSSNRKWFIYWNEGLKGQKRRKKKYGNINSFSTFDERMKAAKKMIKQLQNEKAPSTIISKAYAYLEDLRPTWRRKTFLTNRSKLDTFFRVHGDVTPTQDSVHEFFKIQRRRLHPTTYNDYLQRLIQFFPNHPEWFEGLKKLKNVTTPAKYFQRFQIRRWREYLQENDPELWLFCQFQYYCFIRPGTELRLLKVGDVMLEEDKIFIQTDISKNKKNQYVAIPAVFKPKLLGLMNRNPSEYIFCHPENTNEPRYMNYFGNKFRKARRKLGFDHRYKLYSWKHTGAVAAVKAGIHIKALQLQMRHSTLEETDRYLRQIGINDMRNLVKDFPSVDD